MGDNREALVPGRTPGGPLPGHRPLAPSHQPWCLPGRTQRRTPSGPAPSEARGRGGGPRARPTREQGRPPVSARQDRAPRARFSTSNRGGRGSGAAPCPTGKIRTGVRTLGSRRAASPRPRPPTRHELGPRGLSLLGRKAACRAVPAAPPPARASAQRQNKGCWQHATGVPGPARPAARFPAEAPAPPWDPRPRVLPGAGAQSGVETRALAPPA